MMAPVTTNAMPSKLSRATATYYTKSSSLPKPSLLPWSLDHSCTTWKVGAAPSANHSKSSKLIDEDPNRDEENHIAGNRDRACTNKRTHRAILSLLTTSKKRCHPKMMVPTSDKNLLNAKKSGRVAAELSLPRKSDGAEMEDFFPGLPKLRRCPSSRSDEGDQKDFNLSDGVTGHEIFISDDDSDGETDQVPTHTSNNLTNGSSPEPHNFRRRSTIRDCLDLVWSIEELAQR